MKTYNTILQGHEATEENARNFAQGFDFSQDEMENTNTSIHYDNYIDTINGIEIYYNRTADYYFFADAEEEEEKEPIKHLTIITALNYTFISSGKSAGKLKYNTLVYFQEDSKKVQFLNQYEIITTDYSNFSGEVLKKVLTHLDRAKNEVETITYISNSI